MDHSLAYTHFDNKEFPLVIISFTGNKPTETNFQEYLDKTYHLYNQKQELALVFDATHATLPGYKYQKMQADWLSENESLMKSYCKGTAYVISNTLVRNILKAIFAIQKQPMPYTVVPRLDEAKRWAKKQLANTSS